MSSHQVGKASISFGGQRIDDIENVSVDINFGSKRVIYNDYHFAELLEFLPNGDALIKFENPDLIPQEMEAPLNALKYANSMNKVVNVLVNCPKCDITWKESMLARFPCFDCPNCGAKKEDYVS